VSHTTQWHATPPPSPGELRQAYESLCLRDGSHGHWLLFGLSGPDLARARGHDATLRHELGQLHPDVYCGISASQNRAFVIGLRGAHGGLVGGPRCQWYSKTTSFRIKHLPFLPASQLPPVKGSE
jgi:hypothetical protein